MKQVTLLYHDVIEGGNHQSSGFCDPAARRYKLERSEFVKHLDAIKAVNSGPPVTITDLNRESQHRVPLMLSFDDGGVSGLTVIAEELGQRGWPAHFFITTDLIGTPGFLADDQIRQLRELGHLIGSHSCSHPHPMPACQWETLVDQWSRSVAKLSDILQEPVSVASIPGGAYSKRVAEAAGEAGITHLFTSEPMRRTWQVDRCTVLGRYCIETEDPPSKSAAVASGKLATLAMEYAIWNGKQATKRVAGPHFDRLRDWFSQRARP